MDLPGRGISYWIDSTPQTNYPAQEGNMEADVAVLGGGIAGTMAAWYLKEAGARVILIDARRVLTGVTGYTTAKATAQHNLIYRRLIDKFDRERALLYGEANQAAVEILAGLVQSKGIDCDFARVPAYVYAEKDEQVGEIEAEVEAAQSLGLPATLVNDVPLPWHSPAAERFDNQARFHPRKFLLALLREIAESGNPVLEETTAMDVSDGRPHIVRTNRGEIRAQSVIVATHFPFLNRGLYFGRQTAEREYAIGVRLNGAAPEGMFISPKPDYHSIRPQPTNEGELLIIGAGNHTVGQGGDTRQYYLDLEQWARAHFDIRSVDYHWSTQDNFPGDGLPFIGKYTPTATGLYVATGFKGWGMTHGIVAGKILSDMIQGRPNPWCAVYDPSRMWKASAVGKLAERGLDSTKWLLNRGLSRGKKQDPADIGPGEGRVIRYQGEKMAVSRDEAGVLHAVSPACTHMGCPVTWNRAEQTWDCPCHGSRYKATGEFIHGPTVKDLEPKEVGT